jgi:hypothetical protein
MESIHNVIITRSTIKSRCLKVMSVALKILIIIVVVAIVIAIICALLEISRYMALRIRQRLIQLDRHYHEKRRVEGDRVVITLSTIPDRVKLLGPTLASLLDQTVRVDEICINIPEISRKGLKYRIPKWLSDLKSITIQRVDADEGPGTKLLPTLRRERHNPTTRIIVVDDDNIYNSKTIEVLTNTHRHHQNKGESVAVSNYGVSLTKRGKLPTMSERVTSIFARERETDLLQGFSGFLVTPDMFPHEAFEIKNCPPEAISVDDIWFSGWLHVNGIRIICPPFIYKHMPIVNYGEMRLTPALATGENKDFISDQKVIDWFIREKGMVPVRAR